MSTMTYIKRALLALVLIAGFSPAIAHAQVPAAVPALPDTERRTSYSITASTCACAVNFALYGDSTDFNNWVEVFINGVRKDYNDASSGWTITTPSGSLSTLARPITNAVLTFNASQTGTVQIVGARRPRRATQFAENAGVSARSLNQVLTDIISQNREIWDKTNDVTGRGIFAPPGESLALLPLAATRANSALGFDALGNLTLYTAGSGVTSSANVTFLQSGTNAVARTVQTKLRETLSVTDFATVTDAINEAKARGSAQINFPCGTYSIGTAASSATGINVTGTQGIRISGPSYDASPCAVIAYQGTGAAIAYGGSLGFEVENVSVNGNTAAKLFDGTTGSGANTTYTYIHRVVTVGQPAVTVHYDIASDVEGRFEGNAMTFGAVGIRGITSSGGGGAGQFAVNTRILNQNSFNTFSVSGIQGAESGWTVDGNVFQGNSVGYTSGPAGTCQSLKWLNNWHGDATVATDNVRSNCFRFGSSGNIYYSNAGTGITQTNSTGTVTSTSDMLLGTTAINIGTGNPLVVNGSMDTGAGVLNIVGTPAYGGLPAWFAYGSVAIGTSASVAPLTIRNQAGGGGILLQGSDYVTNGGGLTINRNSGLSTTTQIYSGDNFATTPIVIESGEFQLGGTLFPRTGVLKLKGSTSGTATITVPAAAGTPTVTVGSGTGTIGVTATAPVTLNAATGDIGCATCGVTGSPLSQFAATTSAQLRGVLSDESGTGAAYFQGGDLGTPSAGVATNLTGTASALTAGTASAVAVGGITGLSASCPTWLATASSANLRACVTDESGTGALLFAGGNIGAASGTSLNLSGAYSIGGVVAVQQNGNYTELWQGTGAASIFLGNSASGYVNFYRANQHVLGDISGANAWLTLDTNGFRALGFVGSKAPVTSASGTSSTVGASDADYIINASGTYTLTLPVATGTNSGREMWLKVITAQLVNSASSNVVPLAGGAAGTAIIIAPAAAGKWARLKSDGTNWIIMAGN